jgi:hypothetical protein
VGVEDGLGEEGGALDRQEGDVELLRVGGHGCGGGGNGSEGGGSEV